MARCRLRVFGVLQCARGRLTARSRQRGITLIEVLVAVAVLGIVLIGILRALDRQTHNTAALAERMFAHWAALNLMEEMRLDALAQPRRMRATTQLGGIEWTVTVRREPALDGLTRLTVVSTAEGRAGAVLIGFLPIVDAE